MHGGEAGRRTGIERYRQAREKVRVVDRAALQGAPNAAKRVVRDRCRADVLVVQSVLGLKSATQTLDRYAALWPDRLDESAEAIDAARSAAQQKSARTSRGLRVVQ